MGVVPILQLRLSLRHYDVRRFHVAATKQAYVKRLMEKQALRVNRCNDFRYPLPRFRTPPPPRLLMTFYKVTDALDEIRKVTDTLVIFPGNIRKVHTQQSIYNFLMSPVNVYKLHTLL